MGLFWYVLYTIDSFSSLPIPKNGIIPSQMKLEKF